MNNICTIVIPTRNRPLRLKRLLSYYNECKIDNNIIIADSSSDEYIKQNKKNILSFPDLNILKIRNYHYETDIFYKIGDAVKYVDRKYCVICADDDFTIPNGIKKSVEFLEKNKDFVVAHGRYLGFRISNGVFHWNYSPKTDSNTHSDPQYRLLQHLSNYTLTIYAVHRTEVMNLIWKETTRTKNLGVFGELTASMLTPIYGKMKGLDVFYDFRQTDFTSDGRTAKKLYDYVAEGTYDEKYLRLKNCLSENLSKVAEISIKEAERIVDKGWAEHTKSYKGFVSSKLSYMMKNMSLPPFVDENLKGIHRKVFNRKKPTYIPDFASSHDPQVEKDEEFKSIKKYALSEV